MSILQQLINQIKLAMISDYLFSFQESNENLLQFNSFNAQEYFHQPEQLLSPIEILSKKQNARSETSNQDLNQISQCVLKQKLIKKMPKLKKNRKKSQCDYRKNICGYITQKIIKDFLNPIFNQQVAQFCETAGCSMPTARFYYKNLSIKISGPSHLPKLLQPENEEQANIKQAFKSFFQWFLKNRYLRYIILEGRMENKQAYIDYKNDYLIHLVENNGNKHKPEKYDTSDSFSIE